MYISRMPPTPLLPSSKSSSLTTILGISQVLILTLTDPQHLLLLSHVPQPLSLPGLSLTTRKITPSSTSPTALHISSPVPLSPPPQLSVLTSLLILPPTSPSTMKTSRRISFLPPPKTPSLNESLEEILKATLPLRTSQLPPFHRPSLQLRLPPSRLPPPNRKHPLLSYYLSQRYL